jgi:hypothetical protein
MHLIGRRNFFAGMGLGAGCHLLGAMFEDLLPPALGQPIVKKRWFGFIKRFSQNPVFLPKPGTGGAITLPPALSSLEPYKNRALYMEHFYNPHNRGFHHNGTPLAVERIVASPCNEYMVPDAQTFDRYLAQEIGKGDAYPGINIDPLVKTLRPEEAGVRAVRGA